MGKKNRLSVLQVSHAGHGNAKMSLRLLQESFAQRSDIGVNSSSGILEEQAEIGSDQLVAASTGMEFPSQWSELVNQSALHKVVHVLGSRSLREIGIVA